MGSWVVLEILTFHNFFNKMAWNRLFFNEVEYISSTDYAENAFKVLDMKKKDL